ncbi:hypothetical protein [Saccharopolyspora hattusasensis]|uniref:hypothetical protein n=1 Tax=Saccharopolyspora hattusasensis TaxID=1128679 RepID=UPI003D99D5CB
MIIEPHRFTDGAVVVSDAPGLGVELDRTALKEFHQRWLNSDVRTRDDVAAMRAADPSWVAPASPRW